jgi:hypothetical protein
MMVNHKEEKDDGQRCKCSRRGAHSHFYGGEMVTATLALFLYAYPGTVAVPVPIERATPQRHQPATCQQPEPADYPICADPRRLTPSRKR